MQNLPDLPSQKSGFPVEFSTREKWIPGLFFALIPNPMTFFSFADPPHFSGRQALQKSPDFSLNTPILKQIARFLEHINMSSCRGPK